MLSTTTLSVTVPLLIAVTVTLVFSSFSKVISMTLGLLLNQLMHHNVSSTVFREKVIYRDDTRKRPEPRKPPGFIYEPVPSFGEEISLGACEWLYSTCLAGIAGDKTGRIVLLYRRFGFEVQIVAYISYSESAFADYLTDHILAAKDSTQRKIIWRL